MGRGIFYTMIGYVSGSVLYAKVFGKLFCQKDVTEDTIDGSGSTNAFRNGGIWCGICTLLCDLLKGILPVAGHPWTAGGRYRDYVCAGQHRLPEIFSLVLIVFVEEKGLQSSFGVLLGLYPYMKPVLLLASCFLL